MEVKDYQLTNRKQRKWGLRQRENEVEMNGEVYDLYVKKNISE